MNLPRHCIAFVLLLNSGSLLAGDTVWEAIREGRALVILRHAQAPGIGDPADFRLDDCATQRNLDVQGRMQAQRWGGLFREQGLSFATVYTSRWCRAIDTAEGFGLAQVQRLPALDSFFQVRNQAGKQMLSLRGFIDGLPAGEPVIMVSHQVNITALTGEFPRSAEAFVLALPLTNPPRLLARIPAPAD